MNDEICYGWDSFDKRIFRFVSFYQRMLWIKNGHPDFPGDRQVLDADHNLIRRVTRWEMNRMGFEEGVVE